MWPHDFELQLTVKLGGSGSAASATSGVLKTTLAVLNTGDAPFSFTAALHTYFGVADIAKTRVLGLKGVPYHDGNVPDESALAGRKRFDGDDADTDGDGGFGGCLLHPIRRHRAWPRRRPRRNRASP